MTRHSVYLKQQANKQSSTLARRTRDIFLGRHQHIRTASVVILRSIVVAVAVEPLLAEGARVTPNSPVGDALRVVDMPADHLHHSLPHHLDVLSGDERRQTDGAHLEVVDRILVPHHVLHDSLILLGSTSRIRRRRRETIHRS